MSIYPFFIIYLIFFVIIKWVPSIPQRQDWMSANHFVLAIGSLIYLFGQVFEWIFLPLYSGYYRIYFSIIKRAISWINLIYPFLFVLSIVLSLSYFKQKNRKNLHFNNWLAVFLVLHALHYLVNWKYGFGYTAVTPGWHTTVGTPVIPTNFLILLPIVMLTNFLLVFFKILPEMKGK